jgi:hypothetical protein
MEELKTEVLEYMREIKKTGKWNTNQTSRMFKFNNELNFDYETSYGCGPCVERVFNRLENWYLSKGIQIES